MANSSQLSFPSNSSSPSQLASTSTVSPQYTDAELDPDGDEQDEQAQEAQNQASGAQTPEGQPRKKKTRRAGVAITRVRRMQRDVRKLAEEEEANAQRQQPGRSLLQLQPVQVQPTYPGNAHPMQMRLGSPTSPRYGPFQGGMPVAGPASPPPRSLRSPVAGGASASLNVAPLARPHTRNEGSPPGHGLASAAHPHSVTRGPPYDRILEDGDDVVLLPRLPSASPTGSPSIWAYRPEERDTTRPRGGPA
ncbi:hypothetical protein BD309DRAFT_950412 [Dichomitus squalens]|nr:hypothetical protein BD309DRAFT_950412 [Dichomitus squalens]